jgi:hypothetical protein
MTPVERRHPAFREPWNKGKLIGQKPPLKLAEIWTVRTQLRIAGKCSGLGPGSARTAAPRQPHTSCILAPAPGSAVAVAGAVQDGSRMPDRCHRATGPMGGE